MTDAPSADVQRVYMLLESAWYLYKEAGELLAEAAGMFGNETESARWFRATTEMKRLTFATMRLAAMFEESPTGRRIADDYRNSHSPVQSSEASPSVLHNASARAEADGDAEEGRWGVEASVPKGDE